MTTDDEIARQIECAYPGYHVWASDGGWWYATKTSPAHAVNHPPSSALTPAN